MTRDVETPTRSLADASASWLATVAVGLVIFAAAVVVWLALASLGDLTRDAFRRLLRIDDAEFVLAVAMLQDGATLLGALGLALLTWRDAAEDVARPRRGAWLAVALLVAVCVGEHALIATRTIVTKYVAFGPAGDPLWRTIAVDGRHIAWSIAIAVALLRVATIVPSRRARQAAIAWPVAAAGVVVFSRVDDTVGSMAWPIGVPLLLALLAETAVALATFAIVVFAEARLIRAWRVARLRGDGAVDDRPADACIRCAYDLRGIADDAACPECGLLAGRSRTTASSPLRDAPPAWLRGIARGVWLVLLAEALGAAWPFVFDAVVMPNIRWNTGGFPTRLTTPPPGPTLFGVGVDLNLLLHAPAFACAAILFAGVWLLTRPQRAGARDDVLRRALRAFAFVPIVAFAMTLWNNRAWATGRSSRAIDFAAIGLLTAGCAPIPALMFALLRRLARRVLNANLAEHSTIVGVGLAMTLLAIPPVAIVLSVADLSRSDVALFLMLILAVAFVLFAGWSAVNCIRFALAFRRAEREARLLWRDADRTVDPG